jgi:SAM-dependent methyltransferase
MGGDHRRIFKRVYERRVWGEGSGSGSRLETTRGYRAFLEQFIVEHNIRSVLDAGCGDGVLARAIDWKGARYVGVDVVPQPGAQVADIRALDAFAGFDLLLVKDVLQHWSYANIAAFLAQPALASFRHVLIVNCDDERAENIDISDGEWRPLNLLAPPFSFAGARAVARYDTKRIIHRGPRLVARDLVERFEWWIINLDRRADRLAHVREQLARVGVTQARRFQAFDGHRLQLTSQRPDWVRKGAVGCYLSHLALLKQAQARRAPCVIIEDDLVLADHFAAAFDDFLAEVPEDWEVLLLAGRDDVRPPRLVSPHCARLVATWGTSLAVLRLPAIDRLLVEADHIDRPIDDFYIRMMDTMHFYAPAEHIVWQEYRLGTNIGDAG